LKINNLSSLSRYYFDGHGKAIRPVIAMALGHAMNSHFDISTDNDVISKQRKVAIISEMIHTASLVHDDVLGKPD
jgi:decaprenyl-diphosphate synthase subunit 1